MLFIKKLLNLYQKKEIPSFKGSKVHALARLKEVHNYDYTTFVAKYYHANNHTVWEYSKEQKLSNYPLNLIVKIQKEILLINCKSDNSKLSIENIRQFEQIAKEFIDTYKLFQNYTIRYLFVCSEKTINNEALNYIENTTHISYKILKEFE